MNRIDAWRLQTALHYRLAVVASPLGGWFVQRRDR